MLDWLRANTYIAEWLGVTFGLIAAVTGAISAIAGVIGALASVIAAYPIVKKEAESILTQLQLWLALVTVFIVLRLTMSKQAIDEMVKYVLIAVVLYAIIQSSKAGVEAQSQTL